MTKVLIVTKDSGTAQTLTKTLTYNGFTVHVAESSERTWKFLSEVRFNFIMVDMDLKNESGLSLYKSLRATGNDIPVMMMGTSELDEFILKDLASDNYSYVSRPFHFSELKAKINVFLESSTDRVLSFENFRVDKSQKLLILKNKILQLTTLELDILLLLAQKGGEAVHPKKLAKLLKHEGMTTFFYVNKLRKKLQESGLVEIAFVKDQGYRLSFA